MTSQLKKLDGLRDAFQGARDYQQIEGLQSKIEGLEAEIAQLKSQKLDEAEKERLEQQIEKLTAQLVASGGVHHIKVDLIEPDPQQPRTVFPTALIQERAESLRTKGQLTPIIIIPQAEDSFKLFEGELRWRAAQELGWNTLQAVILHQEELPNPADIFERQIVTSIQSQKLHDLDLAEAIIRLVVYRYPNLAGQEEQILKSLHAALRRLEREGNLPDFGALRIASAAIQQQWLENTKFKVVEEQQILSVILGLQLHPATINKHILPLVKLADDIKAVIRLEGLEGSKAKELNRLSAEQLKQPEMTAQKIRTEATQKAVGEKLSLSEIKVLVNQLINQYNPITSRKPNKATLLIKSIEQINLEEVSDFEDLKALRTALRSKLGEVQSVLKAVR